MNSLVDFVKHNRLVYTMYFYIMSFALKVLRLFVKQDDRLYLFVTYGGRNLCDSPYEMYKAMLKDERFADCKLVWAFRNPDNYPQIENKIKIDSLQYYITALKARCWITNVTVERGLKFKGKNTLYFHTTHVTLPKQMGYHSMNNEKFSTLGGFFYDYSCAQGDYEANLQLSMFGLKPQQVLKIGYPKNDVLVHGDNSENINRIKEKIGIPKDKKTVLYAPTYRENTGSVVITLDFDKWKEQLQDDYVILFRAHPILADRVDLKKYESFVIDVSRYEDNNEIMLASDILISDYSGIFFEYGVLRRPMYCYAYDYEEYTSHRKLYFDIRKELPGGFYTEGEIINSVKNGMTEQEKTTLDGFCAKYLQYYGSATKQSLDFLYEKIIAK